MKRLNNYYRAILTKKKINRSDQTVHKTNKDKAKKEFVQASNKM